MKYKITQLADELNSDQTDSRVRAIIKDVDDRCRRKFNYELTITEVLRNQVEEDKLNPTVKLSPHVDRPCRAVDFRNSDMPVGVKEFLFNYIPHWWPDAVLLWNDRGDASPHCHLAVRTQEPKTGGTIHA